jgi:hypothetical protein
MIRGGYILGGIVRARQIRPPRRVHPARTHLPHITHPAMTARRLCGTAFAAALAIQVVLIVVHGILSDWCFCAITDHRPHKDPPLSVLRFIEFAGFPAQSLLSRWYELAGRDAWGEWGPQLFFVFGLISWFAALLVLLHGMALAARVRIGGDGRGARVRLAPLERARGWQMLLLACVLLGVTMAYGAGERSRWISEAERVFAATMAAASTGRPLPPDVAFSMVEQRGRDYVDLYPAPGFAIEADPHESGDHFLDRFVAPYVYGGWVRFPSGARYRFTVLRGIIGWPADKEGWTVDLHEENAFRR